MISLRLLLEDIKDFRASLNDKRFNPFTAEEWNQAVATMNDPNADDREKEQIKQTTILKNLRLIPMWWLQGWKSKFTYIDDDQYQDIAVDKAMNLINGFSFERGNKYGALLKRSIFNELINQNRKNERLAKKTTTAADLSRSNKDGEEMGGDPLAQAGGITNADFEYVMDLPQYQERAQRIKDQLRSQPHKLAFAYLTNPDFLNIKPVEVVRMYNTTYPDRTQISQQNMSQAVSYVKRLLKDDPIISNLLS
jgi:hypothetical protein